MRFRLTAAMAAISLLVPAASAWAAEPKPEAFYVGLNVGQVRQSALKPADTDDLLLGWSAGYNFNKSFAVEVFDHAYLFPSWITLFGNPLPGSRTEQTDIADGSAGIAAVGAVSLNDSWRLRGRLGVARTKVVVYAATSGNRLGTATRTDPLLGAGLAFDLSPGWTLALDVGRLTKTKVDTVTFGVEFRF